jgi:phage protein D
MTVTRSTRTPGLPTSFYAPDFLVRIEGVDLDPESHGHVLAITVSMQQDDHLTTVDLTLNNYDDTTFDLRWSVFKPNVPDAKPNPSDFTPFRLGARVQVWLGYAEHLVAMLDGTLTAIRADFSDGAPTLGLTVTDPLHALKDSHAPPEEVAHRRKKDWKIARQIADRHGLQLEHDDDGPEHELVVQRNLDDLTFLKERAARIDHKVFIRTDPATGKRVLQFAKPTDGRDGKPIRTWALTWGTLRNTADEPPGSVPPPSLISFTPQMSTAEQVGSVTVRGWDSAAKKAISVTADAGTTPGLGGRGALNGPASAKAKQSVVVNAPVTSEEEAKHLAESLLLERAYGFLTATGKTIGLPDLRPGDNVEIHGVGPTFGGTYHVETATHTLNAGGLLTDFHASRTHLGDGT